MKKIAKGDLTRNLIVDTARKIFNEKGINLTIENLATEMGIPKGRLTNHFSTKEKLFLAIIQDYEDKLAGKIAELKDYYFSKSIAEMVFMISKLMDVQFEYRCAISFLTVLSPSQLELREQIQSGIQRNLSGIANRLKVMVRHKLLDPRILEDETFRSFSFIYVNVLTQWVIYYDMYDADKEYFSVKPLYIRSIVEHIYQPHFSPKGRKEFLKLDFESVI
ncbi:MAG: TetR/AcrR family transcriptional regulator [Chitinophagaceae bacterium]